MKSIDYFLIKNYDTSFAYTYKVVGKYIDLFYQSVLHATLKEVKINSAHILFPIHKNNSSDLNLLGNIYYSQKSILSLEEGSESDKYYGFGDL